MLLQMTLLYAILAMDKGFVTYAMALDFTRVMSLQEITHQIGLLMLPGCKTVPHQNLHFAAILEISGKIIIQ